MIVVDTNILSELMKPKAQTAIIEWMRSQSADTLYTTAISRAEILVGIATLPAGKRREALRSEADRLFVDDFGGRVLAFDVSAAVEFATLVATRRREGRPISLFDAQIAGIVRSTAATLATRNVRDFIGCGFEIIDPWQSS